MPVQPRKRISSYTAAELFEIALRCDALAHRGLIVEADSVALFAEAIRALARERAKGDGRSRP